MNIINIFVLVKDSLYAVGYDNEVKDTYSSLLDNWQDVEYLEQFFEDNKTDLQSGFYGNITIEDAVLQTLAEAAKFDKKIYNAATTGTFNEDKPLEEVLFNTLHKDVYDHIHIPSKAYGPNYKSWLRIYAIRIAPNLYVISGGAIKLTEAMTTEHLKQELFKLKLTANYLKEIGLIEEEDLGYIEIGNNEND